MNVLSLFDGMSCGQLAMERAGIKVFKYLASEIDPHAIKVTQRNFPNTIQLGDITNWKNWDIDWKSIDVVLGGSPCQGFSFAGKQLAFDDHRSKLFFVFMDILNHVKEMNPYVYFLLENVNMKQEFKDVISQYTGVKPIEINSSLVSAQNRRRFYWTNIPDVCQPEDKEIYLKDVVHELTDKSLSNKELNYMLKGNNKWMQAGNCRLERYLQYEESKSFTVTANIHKGVPYNCFYHVLNEYIVPFDKTLQILNKEVEKGKIRSFRKQKSSTKIYYIHNKEVSLIEQHDDYGIEMEKYLFGCITPDRINKRQNGQRFSDGKKFYTLTAQDKHGILIEGYIRKLTPIECERLQTVPDKYTDCVSNTQRYKMLGNGWTVDVIAHIFSFIV